jgi:bifunctional DNA-binding transcriptional regulator/antitoxin component of YhaV-PrlF toxin-antitoxin module
MTATTLRTKRQITLPEEVCSPAGLKAADVIEWTFENGTIVGRKLVKSAGDAPLVKPVRRGGKLMLPGRWTREQVRAAVRSGRERA